MKQIDLPSGAKLEIGLAPFKEANRLLKAFTLENKGSTIESRTELDVNLLKDLFCTSISSELINDALWECAKRCTYNGLKITPELFEPENARQDYLVVMWEVGKANLVPFMKSLFAKLGDIFQAIPQK